jgi:hypothetical protein
MRFKTIIGILAIIGICSCLAPTAQAELVQTINIHLTAHVTTQVLTNGTTRIEKMKIVRITTKEILEMLGKATTNDFKGATLVSVHRGQSYEVRRGTNVLADVTAFFTDEGFSQDVIDQNFDSTSGKDTYHGFWLKSLNFDDHHGNSFMLSGMIEEHYTASAGDTNRMQNVSDTEFFTAAGNGTLNRDFGGTTATGDFALFSGTMLLAGKGVLPLNTF